MSSIFQRSFQSVLSSFLKSPCPLCQRSGQPLCRNCQRQIESCRFDSTGSSPPLNVSGSPPLNVSGSPPLNVSGSPQLNVSGSPQLNAKVPEAHVFAWGSYSGTLKRAIQAMKYENAPEIAQLLGQRLGQCWLEQAALPHSLAHRLARRSLVAVPIPLHGDRLRQRGYNQAELIAAQFCRVTGMPHLPRGLLRVRATAAQHRLNTRDRTRNLSDAFRLGPDWSAEQMNVTVLLIDDIYTTGSTARAAAIELRRAGLKVAGIATVARAGCDQTRFPLPDQRLTSLPAGSAAEPMPSIPAPRVTLAQPNRAQQQPLPLS